MKNIQYTEEEINSLLTYTSRKDGGLRQGEETLAQFLGQTDGHENINAFLRYISNERNNHPPHELSGFKYKDYKTMITHIENLFSIACKHGMTTPPPYEIKRGDIYASRIFRNEDTGVWETDQMLSCSTGSVAQFSYTPDGLSQHVVHIDFASDDVRSKVPFIDVRKVLEKEAGHIFDGENEIILPPFLNVTLSHEETTPPAIGRRGDPFRTHYYVTATSTITTPETNKAPTEANLMEFYEELQVYDKKRLSGHLTDADVERLNRKKQEVKSYFQHSFKNIYERTYNSVFTPAERLQMSMEELRKKKPYEDETIIRIIAEDMVRRQNKAHYESEVFPTLTHEERVTRELGSLRAERPYDEDEALQLEAHAIVEDLEEQLKLPVTGFRVHRETFRAMQEEYREGDDYFDTFARIQRINLKRYNDMQDSSERRVTVDDLLADYHPTGTQPTQVTQIR